MDMGSKNGKECGWINSSALQGFFFLIKRDWEGGKTWFTYVMSFSLAGFKAVFEWRIYTGRNVL